MTAALLTYSAQLLILVAVAALAGAAVQVPLPAVRLRYWRLVVVLGLLLPAVPALPSGGPAAPSGRSGSATCVAAARP